MRLRAGFFIGIALTIFSQILSAQIIQLNVSESGNASISVNGETVNRGEIKVLQVTPGSGIRFDFSNVKDKSAIFRLTFANEHDATSIKLDSNYFKVANTFSSDNKMTVLHKGTQMKMNQPFIVLLGSTKRPEDTYKITLVPQSTSTGGVTTGNAPQPVSGAAPATTTTAFSEQEEEVEKPYQPGSVVYDALKLSDNEKLSEQEFIRIIQHYWPNDTILSLDTAKELAAANPFLQGKWINFNPLKLEKDASSQSGGQLLSGLSFSSIGGLDVTNIADGLAKFLVKRAKQELSIAFFKKFKDKIDSTKELQVLFPQTVRQLQAIDEEIYNYERYIQNLREAFKEDIETIHHNLPGIIPLHPVYFTTHPIQKAILLTGCYTAIELENHTHPGDILANYPTEYLDSVGSINVKGAIQTIQLVSASMRDTTSGEEGNYWVNISKVREMVNNRSAFKIYMGLIYREAINRYQRIPFDKTNLVKILDTVASQFDNVFTTYDFYKRYILKFGDKVNALNKMIREYSKPATDSAKLETYAKYFHASVDLIEYSAEASRLPIISLEVPDLVEKLRKYFDVAYETTDLVTAVNRKNYSAAINHAVTIYNLIRVQPIQESLAGKADSALQVTLTSTKGVLNNLVRYGSFMATVATAKTSDEVADAIETAALPVGSSRVKRETSFNVALNAYVGPYIGFEKIKGVESDKINAYGITAPIGVSFSKGRSILFFPAKTHSSSSIFVSLIDLGAVTAFRFSNDSAEKVPTIELKDIVSPGIFYSHGFGKTPLSLNVGYQIGPLLRRVNLDENEYEKKYSRFSVSLVVDIPIFNLYTRSN